MRQFLAKSPELFYLGLGSIMAFVMAMLRSGGFTRRDILVRLSEACMCAMMSSAISIGANVWLDWSYELSTPIGTFIGFIGTDFLRTLIKGFVLSKADLEKLKEFEKSEDADNKNNKEE